MKNLDWQEILNNLAQQATSQAARARLLDIQPLPSAAEAELHFAEVEEAQAILSLGQRPFMESLDLYAIWHQRLKKSAVLKTLELRDVRHFCLEVLAFHEVLKGHTSEFAKQADNQLFDATEPLSAIDQIMTPEGDIRSDASQTLHQLFNEKNTIVRQTQNVLDRLIRQHEMEPVLQDRYVTNREGRWVLPVRSGKQHSLEGIIHASSQTKQTVFMEPKEIIPLNNRLRQIEVDIEEEIERLLRELSHYLETQLAAFDLAYSVLLKSDQRFAQAQLATALNAQRPTFSVNEVQLKNLKHPLLILNRHTVVPNSVELTSQNRILLLSGPNAGGKTVLLKSIGLAVQMARCGLLIAADPGSKLPFVKTVFVGVGDSQSVDQQLSTFAAHLKVLNSALGAVGPDSLLLIDEICGSTDPEEGTALARGFIEAYANNNCFAVITSHLGPLKLGWKPGCGVINGSLEYDSKSGQPTYLFLMGIAGQSMALQTAKRVGVRDEILKTAINYLSPQTKSYNLGLEELETMKEELRRLKEVTHRERSEAQAEKLKFQSLTVKLEKEKEKILEATQSTAEKKIETLIEHTRVEDVFLRHRRLDALKNEMPAIVKASVGLASPAQKIESAEQFAEHFKPGTKVFAQSIGRDAVVQGVPNHKGEVPVLSQSMRIMVHWTDLNPAKGAENPTNRLARQAGAQTALIGDDRTVDVRGKSLEEALDLLDSQLDTAVNNQEARIKVIHGHGTDTLKKGVRGYLSRSQFVKKWKAGTAQTGGDGVTWAELLD